MNKNPNGHDYEYLTIPASQIRFDDSYQREKDDKRIRDIVKNWNGDVWNTPKVSFRDGYYWCFDGQQSTAARQLLANDVNIPIECKVFYGMTWEEEVDAFIAQTGLSKDVASNYKLRARYNKKDEQIVDMVEICEFAGFKVDFLNHGLKGHIDAVATLYKCYMKLGRKAFIDMMLVIKDAWGTNNDDAVRQLMLSALMKFYKLYWGDIDHKTLVKALKTTTPSEYISAAKSLLSADKNAYVIKLLSLYNSVVRGDKKLEYKL